ncbi:ATP-binding protein [Deinococcus pimensis]|uniref:ATP-binding protein n=1 Tax=Deinococcus pimensis TaxID=309888 RepID=UPI0004B14572|nr:ATP-binding protein [Deinococcus pimensis]
MTVPAPVNILIVDDTATKRTALRAALEPLGQNVVEAASGRDALRTLLADEYAVILLDVRMPDMDGFETASLIRSRPQTETTPIIFVTAHDRAETDMQGGYALGAVDFIFAPVVPEVLRAKVGVFVELHRKTAQVREQERTLRELQAREARAAQDRLRRENERERRATRQEMRKLSSALEQTADPVVITDREGRIEYANPACETVTGYSGAELIGQIPDALRDGGHPDAWPTILAGGVYRGEGVSRRKDGSLYHEELTITPVKDERGRVTHFVSTSKDVTDRKRIEAEMHALNASLEQRVRDRTAQLEDVNKELEAFAYSVSHDLRTPLRHIASFADLTRRELGKDQPGEKAERYLGVITDAATKMNTLIDELLAFSRTGRQDLRFTDVDLALVVEEVRADLTRGSDRTDVEWIIHDLPVVRGDIPTLRQVVTNLLANALKYTRTREHARIEIRHERRDREDVITVTDNGVGFNPRYADKLFGVFQRLHAAHAFEGTGIGLANVKRIVSRHGGHVWARGEEDQGATFAFSLPRPETPASPERHDRKVGVR